MSIFFRKNNVDKKSKKGSEEVKENLVSNNDEKIEYGKNLMHTILSKIVKSSIVNDVLINNDALYIREMNDTLNKNILEFSKVGEATSSYRESILAVFEEIKALIENSDSEIQNLENTLGVLLNEINTSMENMEKLTARFNDTLENYRVISNISSEIDDIASKISLLSLNASIEAARAGEHGKGFAVVADEIKKLSESTEEKNKEITESLKDSIDMVNSLSTIVIKHKKSLDNVSSYAKKTQDVSELLVQNQKINISCINKAEGLVFENSKISSAINELSSLWENYQRHQSDISESILSKCQEKMQTQSCMDKLITQLKLLEKFKDKEGDSNE